jgi:phosphomethylpyrimidine synthase
MIAGPRHLPTASLSAAVQMEKRICEGAPFYCWGRSSTDIARRIMTTSRTDHIGGAIVGA